MKEELPINILNLGGFPEKFKTEEIFVRGQEKVKIAGRYPKFKTHFQPRLAV
jgi:hypothetical protein